jgi:diketogulonate reductase-like aldo/keto reductase
MGIVKNGQLYTTLNNGIEMPLLGLGVYDMYGDEAVNAVKTAIDIGYRMIDTAEMYSNEQQIGKAIKESDIARADLFVTTKVNNTSQGYENTLRAFDKSLELLDLEYVDLYLIHWPIKGKRKETWKAIEKIYASGRAKSIGTGNYLLPFLKELEEYAEVVPAVNQIEFSPYLTMKDELGYCQLKDIQLQAYTPLSRGKKFDDPKLLALGKKYGKTPAQMILRWAVQQEISSIPKSANTSRLTENFNIFNFQIDEGDISLMNKFDERLRLIDDPMEMY